MLLAGYSHVAYTQNQIEQKQQETGNSACTSRIYDSSTLCIHESKQYWVKIHWCSKATSHTRKIGLSRNNKKQEPLRSEYTNLSLGSLEHKDWRPRNYNMQHCTYTETPKMHNKRLIMRNQTILNNCTEDCKGEHARIINSKTIGKPTLIQNKKSKAWQMWTSEL